jgi:hypothetical protein
MRKNAFNTLRLSKYSSVVFALYEYVLLWSGVHESTAGRIWPQSKIDKHLYCSYTR